MGKIRRLLSYKIPDMYTGKIMLDPEEVKRILQSNVFSSPLKDVVEVLTKYEESLFPTERKILEMLREDAQKSPYIGLDDAIHQRTHDAMIELRSKQTPIFEELKKAAQELPSGILEKFRELVGAAEKKLNAENCLVPFSSKDLQYKLERVTAGIKSRGIPDEIKTIQELINISKSIPEKSTETKGKCSSLKKDKNNTSNILNKIRRLSRVLSKSPLAEDKELKNILLNAECKIRNIPIHEPFSRKVFIHDLQKILSTLEDRKLARKLEIIAVKLPTAKDEPAAFILKSSRNSSEKIGYSLICNSVGTVEHLLPKKRGGNDLIDNLGLAAANPNEERAHCRMATQLMKHPEAYINCQKYVDRLIELYYNGTLKKLGISKGYIINFAQKMYRISPSKKPLLIDLSKLGLDFTT